MNITTILFDYGGVIVTPLDPDNATKRRNILAQQLGFANESEMFWRFYGGTEWQQTRIGEMTEEMMLQEILVPLGLSDPAERKQFLSAVFDEEGVLPEMRELIQSLHGRYKLGILSNASDTLEVHLEELGISRFFNPIVNSHRIGAAKPDEQAFKIALERLDVPPEEVYFIDDREGNIAVAASLGIHCHQFTGVSHLREELERLAIFSD